MDKRANRYSPEIRSRAVRMVFDNESGYDSRSAAILAVSEKIGCGRDTLRKWVLQAETDVGDRPGLSTEDKARIKELEQENRELRQANEILKKASAYFAQAELDRSFKR